MIQLNSIFIHCARCGHGQSVGGKIFDTIEDLNAVIDMAGLIITNIRKETKYFCNTECLEIYKSRMIQSPPPRRIAISAPPPRRAPTGKNMASLAASRDGHEDVLRKFNGKLPQSIMLHDKSDQALDLMAEKKSYTSTTKKGNENTAFENSGRGCCSGALSRFPQNVGRNLLMLYTEAGNQVVDPFAGHNSRMELCWRAGRNYCGQDLCAEFMQANRKIKDILLTQKKDDFFPDTISNATIELFEGDSRQLQFPDQYGDFTITSPPYWDIEYYGPESEQLGTGNSYEDFLTGLYQVMRENFRVLKTGAFCVWCINDFRKGGKFYSYHEHTAEGLRQAGFYQWDIAITDLGGSMRQNFPNQVVKQKILPKRHEYCLVFRKP